MSSQKPTRPVRVRIAPSPTGNCHVGTARNALYNLLFARQRNGAFVLRIDDTDQKRSTQESEQGVLEGLRWLDLHWDEGPDVGGSLGPYRQSERVELYRESVRTLLDKGRAYRCFCAPNELEDERKKALAAGRSPKYSGRCRALTEPQVKAKLRAGLKPTVRLKIEPKPMGYVDLIQGSVEQDASLLGDPVILKADGMPTYSYATVVDEHDMQISHVLRSAEHINNTFPQLQMYEALGFEPPEFGHFGLLLNPDRSKISKRAGAVYIGQFRQLGYLPEAMINHLALSGWNPGTEQEIFTFDDLLKEFSLDRCSQSNAIFDRPKLLWLNGYYIRNMAIEDLARRMAPFLAVAGLLDTKEPGVEEFERLKGIVALEQERVKTLAEAPAAVEFFFRDPDPASCVELLARNRYARKHALSELREALARASSALQGVAEWTASALHDVLNDLVAQLGWKRGEFLMPIRIAISGREATPSVFETLEYVGKPATLRRLEAIVDRLAP
jgi:glutamyl-tRNA synthetase